MIDPFLFGNFLVDLRNEKHLTQAQVAEALHLSVKTISKWECGGGLPSIDYLQDIAHFYGVSVDELLQGKRNDTPIETKDKDKNDNSILSMIFYYISIFISLAGMLISFILACVSSNGIAYMLTLLISSLIALFFGLLPLTIKQKEQGLLRTGCYWSLLSAGIMFYLSLFYAWMFRSNITLTANLAGIIYFLSFIPCLICFIRCARKNVDFVETFSWRRLAPVFLISAYAAGVLGFLGVQVLNLNAHDTANVDLVSGFIVAVIGLISSLIAFFFQKHCFVNDWIALALCPLWLVLYGLLSSTNSDPYFFFFMFALSDAFAILDIIRFFVDKRKKKQDTEK